MIFHHLPPVFGQWGGVCDDQFGLNDANVICRQLGFPLGASQALPSHSHSFGAVAPILMDDLQCRGNETSLTECIFSGWGVHNCAPEEVRLVLVLIQSHFSIQFKDSLLQIQKS